jgi:hypothetical protein
MLIPKIMKFDCVQGWLYVFEGPGRSRPLLGPLKTVYKYLFSKYIYIYIYEFCYSVYNQCESFICLDLMIKNRVIPIKRYFKW